MAMPLRLLLSIGTVAAISTSISASPDRWVAWKTANAKTYSSTVEESHRARVFQQNLDAMRFSTEPTQGVNKFSDMTDAEFQQRYLRRTDPPAREGEVREQWDGSCYACNRFPELARFEGSAFDWTSKGAVTDVKTQHCGDCYAFGATGDMEGVWFLAGNKLTPFSEEQIVDCCMADMGILDCAGCSGGNQEWVFDWIVKKGGIDSETTYPYTVKPKGTPGQCKENLLTNSTFTGHIGGWYQVSGAASTYPPPKHPKKANETNILVQLPRVGPITVGIDATSAKLKSYVGGVLDPAGCNGDINLDHAVLIVGFGTDGGKDYWKIKNSWGTDWGESGYFRIVRGENKCGLANDAVHSKPVS